MLSRKTWLYVPTKAPTVAADQEMVFPVGNPVQERGRRIGVPVPQRNWHTGRPTNYRYERDECGAEVRVGEAMQHGVPRMMRTRGSISIATWLKPKAIRLKWRPARAFRARPGPMWSGVMGTCAAAARSRAQESGHVHCPLPRRSARGFLSARRHFLLVML